MALAMLGLLFFSACRSIAYNAAQTKTDKQSLLYGDLVRVQAEHSDEVLAWDVRVATSQALQTIARQWGPLRVPVTVVIHADHRALERALGKQDIPWLRAWARFDRVDLQSPKSFAFKHSYEKALGELLCHELSHVWTYQQLGDKKTWRQAWIPFWFREGLASWTAQQGYRRGSPSKIGQKLQTLHIHLDPLLDAAQLNKDHQPLAYAAAHWAFDLLVKEHGTAPVKKILQDMAQDLRCRSLMQNNKDINKGGSDDDKAIVVEHRQKCKTPGRGFAQAFAYHFGESEKAFAKRFRAYCASGKTNTRLKAPKK